MRSGIYHEGKIYETDGVNAIDTHDPANVVFLSPIGRPAAVRCFESFSPLPGEWDLSYFYINPAGIKGPDSTIELAPGVEELGLEIRIGAVLQDSGISLDPKESDGFILGYTFFLVFTDRSGSDTMDGSLLEAMPARWTEMRDTGALISPFVVTPEELAELRESQSRANFAWKYQLYINDKQIEMPGNMTFDQGMDELLALASRRSPVGAGEVITWPALPTADLATSSLERNLIPGDKIRVVIEGLGALTGRIG